MSHISGFGLVDLLKTFKNAIDIEIGENLFIINHNSYNY